LAGATWQTRDSRTVAAGVQWHRVEALTGPPPQRILHVMDPKIDKARWQAAYRARYESLERLAARELASMTEEEALRRMYNLVAVGKPWRQCPDYSGLVEQQRLFMRARRIGI